VYNERTDLDQDKLTSVTGISPQYQVLSLHRSTESKDVIAALDDETRTLESYGVADFNCIKVGRNGRVFSQVADRLRCSTPTQRLAQANGTMCPEWTSSS
jgi:hypothetical protein